MDNVFLSQYLGTQPRESRWAEYLDRVLHRMVPWLRIQPAWRGRMASIESRMNVFHLLGQVIHFGVPGDIVEIGCYAGESSVVLQRILRDLDPTRKLHVYDSFSGVPPTDSKDRGAYAHGDMATSEASFRESFHQVGLDLPLIHRGWFEETLPGQLPDHIAFALLDADLYRSTLVALNAVYPRLARGGICLLGVYWDAASGAAVTPDIRYRSPGVKAACDEFFADKPERVSVLLAGKYTSGHFRKG
jgi:O-methyltransferase